MNADTTRQKLLQYLQTHRRASVPELSLSLHVTRQDVRYNLNALIEECQVTRLDGHSQGSGHHRGRPSHLYQIVFAETQTTNLENLVQALYSLLEHSAASSEQNLPNEIASALFPIRAIPANLLHKRLTDTVQAFNVQAYQAAWEARPSGPCILLANCPYATILSRFPILCEVDRLAIQRLIKQRMSARPRKSTRMALHHTTVPFRSAKIAASSIDKSGLYSLRRSGLEIEGACYGRNGLDNIWGLMVGEAHHQPPYITLPTGNPGE